MLDKVKLALRLVTDAFDGELSDLIDAAYDDLALAGVSAKQNADASLIRRAVITYCKANFGTPDEYDRLKAAYDEQKAQLMIAADYTDWGDDDGSL